MSDQTYPIVWGIALERSKHLAFDAHARWRRVLFVFLGRFTDDISWLFLSALSGSFMGIQYSKVIPSAFVLMLLLILLGCDTRDQSGTIQPTISPVPRQTSVAVPSATLMDLQMDSLTEYIVKDLAGGGKIEAFIARIEQKGSTTSLAASEASIRQCWFSQMGSLKNCTPKEFLDSYHQEQYVPWKHVYMIFEMVSVDKDYTKAVIRLDDFRGPKAATGYLITVIRVNGQWHEESRQVIFVS